MTEDRNPVGVLGDLSRVDHIAREFLEIAVPCSCVGLLADQRLFVEDLETMIGAQQIAESGEVGSIDAVDKADGERDWWQRLGHWAATVDDIRGAIIVAAAEITCGDDG